MQLKPTKDSQISLFIKSYTGKACFLSLSFLLIAGAPIQANAGFFSDIFASVTGSKAQATDTSEDSTHNSQNIPLLETSVDPDMKNANSGASTSTIEDGALLPDSLQGTDSVTNSYISSSEKITTYKVESGDTLAKVASMFGISKNTILYANTGIKNNALKVGQVLTILPVDGVSYTVKKGDSLASIAKAHKADAKDIAEYNDISDKNLKSGDKIIVPGGVIVKKVEAPAPIAKVEQGEPEASSQSQSENKPEKSQASPEDISSGNGITGDYIWPLPKGVGRVSQRLHDDNAYDFAAPKGTPIYAIQDGTVLIADGAGYNGGYGKYVVVNFNDGGQAIFGHMNKVTAFVGETVQKGDVIGYVGSTGRSTGNHVHIGYRGGKPNPYRNLPKNSNGL
ncbi:MAG: M23 family metallopeptidase [Candidatus Paceibacterota bacterium]|jgi:murein DD-endopeptidase MepM/ murein hydrolase activator NlpD